MIKISDLEHPDIKRIQMYGYVEKEPTIYGNDYFGVEILEGDTLLVIDDLEVVIEECTKNDLIKILRRIGAEIRVI